RPAGGRGSTRFEGTESARQQYDEEVEQSAAEVRPGLRILKDKALPGYEHLKRRGRGSTRFEGTESSLRGRIYPAARHCGRGSTRFEGTESEFLDKLNTGITRRQRFDPL